jgi:hypothetical protein
MKIYQAKNEDFVESMIHMLEQDTQKKIFTFRILEETPEGLEVLVVFTDECILMGNLNVGTIQGKLALRMKGKYV